jgi:hypothetical protein
LRGADLLPVSAFLVVILTISGDQGVVQVNMLCLDFSNARIIPYSTHHYTPDSEPAPHQLVPGHGFQASIIPIPRLPTRLDPTRPDPTRLVPNPTAYVSVASSRALSSEDDHRRFHHHRFTTVTTITNRIKTR